MILTRAPFRISLGGGGTDLPSYYSKYGGYFVSATIDKYLYIYVNKPAADNFIRVKYSKYEQVNSPDEVQHDLVRPALNLLNIKGGLEIVSMADIPSGTGLGSSGTYLVALLTALHAYKRENVPITALAEQACHIEIDLAGHPVGKQDQYISAIGGLTGFEIDLDGTVTITPLDVSMTTTEEFRNNVLLFYTGMLRPSANILSSQKTDTMNNIRKIIESLHRTKELGYRVKEAIEDGDLEKFGHLLHEHWCIKKVRSQNISNSQIDRWYEIARESGALGGKIMGAGGGGFFMFYCENSHKLALRKKLTEAGLCEMKYGFDFEGAKVMLNV